MTAASRQGQSAQLLVTKTKTVCIIIGHKDKDSVHNYWSQRQKQRLACTITGHHHRRFLQRPPIARKLPFTLADARRSKVRCGEKEFEDGKCRVAFS